MKNTVFVFGFALLFSLCAVAKSAAPIDIRYKTGLMKSIRCQFYGKTATGPSMGSFDFKEDADNTVCDPLSNTPSTSPANGLLARLIVRNAAMGSSVNSVMDYYNKGDVLDKKIFFASVNVPTRPFTEGFSTQSGDILVDAQGNRLIENFALEYSSVLQLGPNDPEGNYEIASLGDDGVRLFIKENNIWNELINNDGNHATRMGCPYRTVLLKKDSKIPIKLLYYQGPRFHITNVLIWKKHASAQAWKEPSNHSLCGYTGNNYFFNSNNGKKGLAMVFLELTGWKTIGTQNYKMPEQTSNPCTMDPISLSNFAINALTNSTASFSWTTNYPSTSQLRILNQFTFEEIYTDLDSTLVTAHSAKLTGLTPGVQYQVQAISKDAQGREIRSAFIELAP